MDLSSLETVKLDELFGQSLEWLDKTLIDQHVLAQSVMAVFAFFLGALIFRITRSRIREAIDGSSAPIAVKRVLNNLRKLVFPLVTLVVLFVLSQFASAEFLQIKTGFADGIMKVLLAWIIIRVALQFIGNAVIRNFFALLIWGIAALSIFGILEETTATLDAIGFSIGDFRLSALAIIKAVLSIFALLYMALFVSTFAERRVLRVKSLNRSSQVLIAKIIRVALVVFALLIGITSAGIDLSLFAVFGGAVGLGIGFGLQKGISNLFSGMLLLMDQSIKPGDVLELENSGVFGWVNHMGARYTEIVTRDNKSFLIPNEDFITQRVVNWSHGNSLIRLQVHFGVHYDSDPHLVKKVAEKAAAEAPSERIVSDPSPVCWLIEFGDSSINFTLRFWIKDAEQGVTNIRGIVMLALWDALKENGINIPYPHREIYIHNSPDAA